MKITAVKAILLKTPCKMMSDAISVCTQRQALLVKIETDSGIYGIGESFCFGNPLVIGKHIIEDQIAPMIIGEDPDYIEKIWNTVYWRSIAHGRRGLIMGALSGIDIALWDIRGKAYNLPVSKLLGAYSDSVPSYASGGFYAPDKDLDGLRREIEGYLKKGYRDVKIKIGRNPGMQQNAIRYMANQDFGVSYEDDVKRIAAARDVMGSSGRLIADINACWDAAHVIQAREDFERAGLNWLEEPTVFEDREGCRAIAETYQKILINGYETEQGAKNWLRMIENREVDIVQPDIGWTGGFTDVRKIGDIAYAADLPVSLHSFGSAVHFAASIQMSAALANVEVLESEENPNPLKTDILKEDLVADEHMNFYVPDAPGLGIELDWDKMEKYLVK